MFGNERLRENRKADRDKGVIKFVYSLRVDNSRGGRLEAAGSIERERGRVWSVRGLRPPRGCRERIEHVCGGAATNHHYSMCIATLYNYTYNAKHQVMAQSCMCMR